MNDNIRFEFQGGHLTAMCKETTGGFSAPPNYRVVLYWAPQQAPRKHYQRNRDVKWRRERKSIKFCYKVSYSLNNWTLHPLEDSRKRRFALKFITHQERGRWVIYIPRTLHLFHIEGFFQRSFSSPCIAGLSVMETKLGPKSIQKPSAGEGFRCGQEAAFIWQLFGQGSGIAWARWEVLRTFTQTMIVRSRGAQSYLAIAFI